MYHTCTYILAQFRGKDNFSCPHSQIMKVHHVFELLQLVRTAQKRVRSKNDPASIIDIADRGQIKNTLTGMDIEDISDSFVIWFICLEIPVEHILIFMELLLRFRLGASKLSISQALMNAVQTSSDRRYIRYHASIGGGATQHNYCYYACWDS